MSYVQTSTLSQDVLQICRQCPMATFQNAYIRAARQLCAESRWLRSTLLGSTTAPVLGVGTAFYNLGSDAYSEVVGVSGIALTKADSKTQPLTRQDTNEWDTDDEFDQPQVYCYLPNAQIGLHPTPDAVYPLTIGLVLQPKFGATAIDDSLLVKWREALNNGTLGYLLALPGTAWADKKEAFARMSMFQASINEARSDAIAGYNAGSMPTGVLGPPTGVARTRMQAI